MRLGTLVGALSLLGMLLLASPGVRIERIPAAAGQASAPSPLAAAPR